MLRISGWKRQSVRKLAKPKNLDNSKTSRPARNQPKRNEKLSKTEQILNAYDRQVSQHLMISKERFLHMICNISFTSFSTYSIHLQFSRYKVITHNL